MELVIHLAAEHADDVAPASLYYDVNVGGARNVTAACRTADVRRIIFTSTVAVYGLSAGIAREDSAIDPFNDYGHSKWQSEEVLVDWQTSGSNHLTILRPCVVFGECNRGNVYNLINMIHGGRFMMVGSGRNRKSMAYVENIAAFIASCIDHEARLEIFNYSDAPDLTTADLIAIIRSELGHRRTGIKLPLTLGFAAGHAFDLAAKITGRRFPISAIRIRKFNADTQVSADRALATGFRPIFSIADGLRRTIRYEFN
jgi:nucleoside-diphosphate-sugar epimerase